MKKTKLTTQKIKKALLGYGVHLWLLLFIANIALLYSVHFYIIGKTCFTPQQVATDNRCLYIWSNKVYEKGTKSAPHQGHPCGTDITSVIPPTHIANQSSYLLPNYVGDICTQEPPTQAPPPTNTPTPTNKPNPSPTSSPTPSLTPSPTTKPTQVLPPPIVTRPTSAPTLTPTPTKQIIISLAPVVNPTAPLGAPPVIPAAATATPFVLPIATPITQANDPPPAQSQTTVLVGPGLNFSFSLPGFASIGANLVPNHLTRQVAVALYPPGQNASDPHTQPAYNTNVQAVYDANASSPTYGDFLIHHYDLGTSVKEGTYQVMFKTDSSLQTLIKAYADSTEGIHFNLKPGQDSDISPYVANVLVGDLNNDNKINSADFTLFFNCYGNKATSPQCTTQQTADFNDNGVIDGIDYNIMLLSSKAANAQTSATPNVQLPQAPRIITPTVGVSGNPLDQSSPGDLTIPTQPGTRIIGDLGPTVKTQPTPSPTPLEKTAGSSSGAGVIFFLFFIIILIVVGVLFRKKIMQIVTGKSPAQVSAPQATAAQPAAADAASQPQIEKVYYVAKYAKEENTGGYFVTLKDDKETLVGYYSKEPPPDGQYTVKGVIEQQGDKSVLVISEIK